MGKRALILILFVCWMLLPRAGQGEIYMRVVARDNSPAGQAEKIRVRDAALECLPRDERMIPLWLPLIRTAAEKNADCRVEMRLWRPEKNAPLRPTVYITIGPGGGKNWWGVLYPNALRLAGEETDGEKVEFVFPFLSWLFSLF